MIRAQNRTATNRGDPKPNVAPRHDRHAGFLMSRMDTAMTQIQKSA